MHLAQLVVLVVGAASAVIVALLLGRAIVDGQQEQAEHEIAQQQLSDARQTLQAQTIQYLIGRVEGDNRKLPVSVKLDYLVVAATLRRVSQHGHRAHPPPPAGVICEGCRTASERKRALAALDRMDGSIARWTGRAPPGLEEKLGRDWDTLNAGLNGWVAAHGDEVASSRGQYAAATRRLAMLSILIIGALSLGSLLIWVLLDRIQARARREINGAEHRSHALAQNSSDIVMIVDSQGFITYASPSVKPRLGRSADELVGLRLAAVIHPEDKPRLGALEGDRDRGALGRPIEWRFRRADGAWRWVESMITDARAEPSVAGWVLNTREISDRKEAEQELTRQAFEDSLTGLANRALFTDRLEHALASRARGEQPVAIALIDLDDFKTINDSLGHGAGDRVLTELALRISGSIRQGDTAARLGGDEFAVLVQGVGSHEARLLAERMAQDLARPLTVEGDLISMPCSIGVAFSDPDATDGTTLLRNADVAMYTAKAQPGSAVALYRPEMQAAAHERMALKRDLAFAAERKEFNVVFQPIFALEDESVRGLEALMRWEHPKRGLISPAIFIPLAEETGLINDIGRWVLETACRQVSDWRHQHGADLYVGVNVSGAQLDEIELPTQVAEVLQRTGLPAECLVIEITESALPASPELAIATLQRLKDLGIELAIDDFGTGYSSLSYLASLPVDVVKMDKCFVDGVGKPGREYDLAATILRIGSGLGLGTVAEGIERPEQVDRLLELGCEFGQGYYLARPLPAAAVEGLLLAEASNPGRRVRGRGVGASATTGARPSRTGAIATR